MSDKTWSVYQHKFPNGKVYIGKTSMDPNKRWANGFGYHNRRDMFSDIVKFGWDNIEHTIIAEKLDADSASHLEKSMIEAITSSGKNRAYNVAYSRENNPLGGKPSWWNQPAAKIVGGSEFWIDKYISDDWYEVFRNDGKSVKRIIVNDSFVEVHVSYCDRTGDFVYAKMISEYPKEGMSCADVIGWINGHPDFKVKEELRCNFEELYENAKLSLEEAKELVRRNNRERQRQGIEAAKERGAYKGRKPIEVDKMKFEALYSRVLRGECTNRYAMRELGLKPNTYYKAVNNFKEHTGPWA